MPDRNDPTGSVDPTKAQFAAFRALPQDRPIQMLNLIRFRERAEYPTGHADHGKAISGADAYRAYSAAAAPHFVRAGGRQVWLGRPEQVVIGPSDEGWSIAFVAEYPDAKTFVAMITDPEYREIVKHRQAAVADSRLIRLSPQEPSDRFGE